MTNQDKPNLHIDMSTPEAVHRLAHFGVESMAIHALCDAGKEAEAIELITDIQLSDGNVPFLDHIRRYFDLTFTNAPWSLPE